jgi:hypothetical protein
MGTVIKFPDAGYFSFVYYVGMDALLQTHRSTGESMWINGSDIGAIVDVFRQVEIEHQKHKERRHAVAD